MTRAVRISEAFFGLCVIAFVRVSVRVCARVRLCECTFGRK